MPRLLIAIILLVFLAPPASAEWPSYIGKPLPGKFFSAGAYVKDLGWPAGQYGHGRVVVIDSEKAEWCNWTVLPVGPGHESVSVLQLIDGGIGLNAMTESGKGSQIWTAWKAQGWRWTHTQTFPNWPWALAGPSAEQQGWVCLSEGRPRRTAAAWVAKWGAQGNDRWEPITPTIPGVMAWDAAPWKDGIVLGCSIGNGEYLSEWAGRLVFVRGLEWRLVNLPAMAGAIRVGYLERYPGRLFVCTAWGEIWWTDDLETFTRWHSADYGFQKNAFLYEVDNRLVVVGAGGKVWEYKDLDSTGEIKVSFPNSEFLTLRPAEISEDRYALGGTIKLFNRVNSRPVVIHIE
jgi:hypothetical protein